MTVKELRNVLANKPEDQEVLVSETQSGHVVNTLEVAGFQERNGYLEILSA